MRSSLLSELGNLNWTLTKHSDMFYEDEGCFNFVCCRREIGALQAENYSLERQLFSYQKSIAFAHSKGTYSDDLATPDGRCEEDDEPYYEDRAYSLGDRSLSTDTEYA